MEVYERRPDLAEPFSGPGSARLAKPEDPYDHTYWLPQDTQWSGLGGLQTYTHTLHALATVERSTPEAVRAAGQPSPVTAC